jgi:hypothetical protein
VHLGLLIGWSKSADLPSMDVEYVLCVVSVAQTLA